MSSCCVAGKGPVASPTSNCSDRGPCLGHSPHLTTSVILPKTRCNSVMFVPTGSRIPYKAHPHGCTSVKGDSPSGYTVGRVMLHCTSILLVHTRTLVRTGGLASRICALVGGMHRHIKVPAVRRTRNAGLSRRTLHGVLERRQEMRLFLRKVECMSVLQ